MNTQSVLSIHHDGSGRYVKPIGGQVVLGGEVTLRLRIGRNCAVRLVLLRTCPDGEENFSSMYCEAQDEVCCWWEARLTLTMPVMAYRFLVYTEDGAWWYNGGGAHRHLPTDAEDFRVLATYQPPAWLADRVFYQIFPDRFWDGDFESNVRTGEYVYQGLPSEAVAWGMPSTAQGRAKGVEFYGGDLQGVEQRLGYLADLGINALYLTPVFTAFSNHRYDVTDYYHVDAHVGGDAALISLREKTRSLGMRMMLDIVPNHCGVAHPWFQEALTSPDADVAEYFTFFNHPDDYASWLGVRSLPKFNYKSEKLRKVMYADPGAVFRYWLAEPFEMDAWRIDVANMLARQGADQLGIEIGQGIRCAVKETNPQAYLLGENFFDATGQLQGDFLDASMNYAGFTRPLWYWLTHFGVWVHDRKELVTTNEPISTEALVDAWRAYLAPIPWVIACQQLNLLDSHDTPRIKTILKGDMDKVRLAVGILFTFPGIPCVYYGDEIGMSSEGGDSRACMVWESEAWNVCMRSYFQELIALRKTSPALIHGGFQVLLAEGDRLVYLRDAENEKILVVGNRGPGTCLAGPLAVADGGIADGSHWREFWTNEELCVTGGVLQMAALPPGVTIWRCTD